jgi:DNA polymerase III, epsilon subunit and related 3''-5'' exonucleases
MNFLNTHKDLPIIAHSAKYDRDRVLYRAFKKVGNLERFPPKERWRCTFDLACDFPAIKDPTLDGLLEYCSFDRRDPDEPHNALNDCYLTAKVYMKMKTMPPAPLSKLGF